MVYNLGKTPEEEGSKAGGSRKVLTNKSPDNQLVQIVLHCLSTMYVFYIKGVKMMHKAILEF